MEKLKKGLHPDSREPFQREQDLERIVHWYLSGKTQKWIGEQLGIAQSTVGNDLKLIQERWQRSSLINWNEAKNRTLARIDWIEQEAVEAWERSKGDYEQVVISDVETVTMQTDAETGKQTAKRQPKARTTRGIKFKREGNKSYLDTVAWCVEQRCQIFGLYANKDMSPEEVQNILNQYAEAVIQERQSEWERAKNAPETEWSM